ncbi:MAG: HdeD family acid-resistance protein [Oligoflexales bacterium]
MAILAARRWWSWVVRGLAAIILGVCAFTVPGITLAGLVLMYGVYAFVDGIVKIASVFVSRVEREREGVWWPILGGIAGIAVGVMTFMYPAITLVALVYLVAAWALVTGILEVASAIELRKEVQGEWLLALSGVLSILFSFLLVLRPGAGMLGIMWMLGAYMLLFGVLLISLGFRMRSFFKHERPLTPGGQEFAYR